MVIRRAAAADLDAVEALYGAVIDAEEAGRTTTGWKRGIYPTRQTAADALALGTLYVLEDEGEVRASAKIDQTQVDVYAEASWTYPAPDSEVLVLHTLVVDPAYSRRGYGRAFVAFYEQEARRRGCTVLRMDTNERNLAARRLYASLGYTEPGKIPCNFNGLEQVILVYLEKKLP